MANIFPSDSNYDYDANYNLDASDDDDHVQPHRETTALINNEQKQSCGALVWKSVLITLGVLLIGGFACVLGRENNATSTPQPPNPKATLDHEQHYMDPAIDVHEVPFPMAPNDIFPSSYLGELKPPFPTHAFWFNLVIQDGIGPAVLIPYSVKCLTSGVFYSYPSSRRTVTVTTESDYFENDIGFTAVEGYMARYITDYNEFAFTMNYDLANGGSYKTIGARGSPYGTVVYKDATPVILCEYSNVTMINGEDAPGTVVSGTDFTLEQNNGMRWMVFFNESVELTVSPDGNRLTTSAPYTGVVRTALSPSSDSDEMLQSYAMTSYPVGGVFDYSVDGDNGTYYYNWMKEGDGPLLIGAVKHLTDIMDASTNIISYKVYQSMKGPVDLIEGDSWTLTETLPTTTWYAPREITDETKLDLLVKQLRTDVSLDPPSNFNPYYFGKVAARMARIALIAEEYNVTDVQWEALAILEEYMTQWLTGTNGNRLVYETNYGGVVTSMGVDSWKNDFGSGWYNDHHFHYGYFLYALAVIIKMDAPYYETYQTPINFILGDIGNRDPNSPYFPYARHKDFYDHHSWALGLFQTFDGKSQESSSESVNAYYGMWLLGIAVRDQELTDWGRVLLAMELRGAHYYWQVHPGNEEIYDEYFAANKMVGQIGGLDAFCKTWFGNELQYIHGINLLPFTPITEELLPYEYILEEWPVVKTALENEDITPAWEGILYLDYAIVDPSEAWDLMTALDDTALDDGFSMANSMYWILTREDHGYYDNNATAQPQVVQAECAVNQGCANRGYTTGNCCPADDGTYNSCCPVTS
mmetsp:Transcript_30230/g.38818  ORF Transcript_30230/g.38818 Transcript_30230/m.38818 type:complete len:812 (+) Transcript_30230:88-2523(+)